MATGAAAADDENLPRKVYQDDFRPGRGNALQAAVASIFGLELIEVPNFVELPEGYEAAIQNFCFDRSRSSVKLKLGGDTVTITEEYKGQFCVLRGMSPRGDFGHVVVARRTNEGKDDTGGFEMIHDPHPDETFLDESEPFGWCMFFNESDCAYDLPQEGTKWPELLGKDCTEAESFLRESYGPKFVIVVVAMGSPVTCDYRLDRVRLYVDEKTKTTIAQIPGVG